MNQILNDDNTLLLPSLIVKGNDQIVIYCAQKYDWILRLDIVNGS